MLMLTLSMSKVESLRGSPTCSQAVYRVLVGLKMLNSGLVVSSEAYKCVSSQVLVVEA